MSTVLEQFKNLPEFWTIKKAVFLGTFRNQVNKNLNNNWNRNAQLAFKYLLRQPTEMFCKNRKTPVPESFFNKKKLEKDWHSRFPVIFEKSLRTPWLQSTSGRLLLYLFTSVSQILWCIYNNELRKNIEIQFNKVNTFIRVILEKQQKKSATFMFPKLLFSMKITYENKTFGNYTYSFNKPPVYKQLALGLKILEQLSGLNSFSLSNKKNCK